jgi:hypothetical protein
MELWKTGLVLNLIPYSKPNRPFSLSVKPITVVMPSLLELMLSIPVVSMLN